MRERARDKGRLEDIVTYSGHVEDLFNDKEDEFYKRLVGMASNMKAKGYSTEQIAEITSLSEIEILEL